MGDTSLGLTKFFVTNLPERCSSLDIRVFFSVFGEVTGVYVARKRDKKGNKFCFVSFTGVKDPKELEGRLMGIKMGQSKLLVNVARFAVENSGFSGQKIDSHPKVVPSNQNTSKVFNFRDQRSYCDVLGKGKEQRDPVSFIGVGCIGGGGVVSKEKMVVVPDRVSAFKEVMGSAVFGRTTDLETLVDLDKLFRIAKVDVVRIQYLGGLSVIISFSDADVTNKFLESPRVWGPWFSKLEAWGGQSLPI
ncbi:putative RNA recognition motif domain, nucleotide-binding alpha-beta plait domain superfamily [Helianthus annuus]|nr:putative RNA recognition motif domain, nucleotide-binding alpha-beta plait domain superfamily [Helianthus annuus]KAJ0619585.1 putative RNA recognition motif domain, nucleotide-binding alpha-beta plait domain superfamily [Helianthus annuus]